MSDNSYEYLIKQKVEGVVLVKKAVLIFLYLFMPLSLTILILTYASPLVFIPLILLTVALDAVAILVSWRFTCIEYEIIIAAGELIISTVYGKRTRKQLCNLNLKDISEIGEYDDRSYNEINKLSLQKNFICVSSMSAPTVYYAIFDEDKDKCIIYFEADEKAISLLKKYNSSAFRAAERRIAGR